MTKSEAKNIIAYRLGNRTDLDTRIYAEMGLVQETQLERGTTLPWFLFSEKTLATVSGTETVALPSGFLREYEDGALFLYQATATKPWTPLTKDSDLYLRPAMGDTLDLNGTPKKYTTKGSNIHLRPVPNAVFDLRLDCYVADTAIASVSEPSTNSWLTNAPDLLIAMTTLQMAQQLDLVERQVQRFRELVQVAIRRMIVETEARLHSNRRYQMGDS